MTEGSDQHTAGHRSTAATGGGVSTIRVDRVAGRRELDRFIRLPWRIYRDDPAWVPPLMAEVRSVLDRSKHPFHEHAEVDYFLAYRGDELVGRIAGIVNRQYIEFHGEQTGFFGLFESVDDGAVARALTETVESWLSERGMTRVEGPFNLSTNDELYSPGVLVEGNEHDPFVLMAHTPSYYGPLLEAAGYAPARDLVAYFMQGSEPPARMVQGVARLMKKVEGLEIRALDMKRFDDEVARIQEIYNSAWERNWGFTPMTADEIHHLARQLKPIVVPDMCLIAEVEGRPVGFALSLPDYNQAVKHMNGRLFPIGLLKFLWHKRRIDQCRILTLGVRREYRSTGLGAILYLRLFHRLLERGYRKGEASWILDDNWEMRRPIERTTAEIYKTYRVYGKDLGL